MLEIKVGTVLGKEGAWQRKYLVTHITQTDEQYHQSLSENRVTKPNSFSPKDAQLYEVRVVEVVVCLKYLGEFWAHGGSKPSLKQPEREVKTSQTAKEKLWLGWYSVDKKWDGSRLKN
jgi:hypothetical protein